MVEVMRSCVTKTSQENPSNTNSFFIANLSRMEKINSPRKVRPLSHDVLSAKDFWVMEKSFRFKEKGISKWLLFFEKKNFFLLLKSISKYLKKKKYKFLTQQHVMIIVNNF